MAIFKDFESKEDIFQLLDRFEKSSLFELEINITSPIERNVLIKMSKSANGKINYRNTHSDVYETDDNSDEIQNGTDIKMSKEKSSDGNIIKSPLVGTFYSSSSPESEPYVKPGDRITKGMVLCIIEAMKTMNEIESETDGEIAEVLAVSGTPVEFGQPLFRLK